MNSYYLIFSIFVLTACVAWLAVRTSRETRIHCAELEACLLDAGERMASLETVIAELTRFDQTITCRVDKLAAHEGRVASNGGRPGFTEAIALIEHGANADQLIESCGIGRAEARLVEVLYGREDAEPAAEPAETIVVDQQLNVIQDQPAA